MGASLPDFLPFPAFKVLIVPYIKQVGPIAKTCLESIFRCTPTFPLTPLFLFIFLTCLSPSLLPSLLY